MFRFASSGTSSSGGDNWRIRNSMAFTRNSSSCWKQLSGSGTTSKSSSLYSFLGGLRRDFNSNQCAEHTAIKPTSPKQKVRNHVRKSPGRSGGDTAELDALYQPTLPAGLIYFLPYRSKKKVTTSTSNGLKNDTDGARYRSSTVSQLPETVSAISLVEALVSIHPPLSRSPTSDSKSRIRNSSDGNHGVGCWVPTLSNHWSTSTGFSSDAEKGPSVAVNNVRYQEKSPRGLEECNETPSSTAYTTPLWHSLSPTVDDEFLEYPLGSTLGDYDSDFEVIMSRLGFPRSRALTRPDSAMSGLAEMQVDTTKLPPPTKDTMRFASPRSRPLPAPAGAMFGSSEMSAMVNVSNLPPASTDTMRFASPRSQAPRRGTPKSKNQQDPKDGSTVPRTGYETANQHGSPHFSSLRPESTMSGSTRASTSDSKASQSSLNRPPSDKESILEEYLGIYKPDHKLGHGRSTADEFAARLVSKFSRKGSIDSAKSESKLSKDGAPSSSASSASSLRKNSVTSTTNPQEPGDRAMSVPDILVSAPRTGLSSRSSGLSKTPLVASESEEWCFREERIRCQSLPNIVIETPGKMRGSKSQKKAMTSPVEDLPPLPNVHEYIQRPLPVPPLQSDTVGEKRHYQSRSSNPISFANHKHTTSQDITNDLANWAEAMFPVPDPVDPNSQQDSFSNPSLIPSRGTHTPPSLNQSLSTINELPTPPPTATTRNSSVYSLPPAPLSPNSLFPPTMNFPIPPSHRKGKNFSPDTSSNPSMTVSSNLGADNSDDELEAFFRRRPVSSCSGTDGLPESLDYLDDKELDFLSLEDCASGNHVYAIDGFRGGIVCHKDGDSLEREIEVLLRESDYGKKRTNSSKLANGY